ncbi:MAG: Tim44/TimA family putative adaptor protein [Alphaproteobacteria bacterium]
MEGGSFPFVDIIFFAMVAAFLVLRLRSVLGRRTGHERPQKPEYSGPSRDARNDNVVALPDRSKSTVRPDSPAAAGLAQIKIADPSFSEAEFLRGARAAFEMIVTAFSSGDRDTLRPLTSGEVYANLERVIRDREKAGHALDATLVGVKSVDIVEAGIDEREAQITLQFVSEQVNVTRDGEGEVISGRTDVVDEVTDIWTFARDVRAQDPNWYLVATRAPEA